jgi:hypothetical protein
MNKPVDPASIMAAAKSLSAGMRSAVRSLINDPAPAEQEIAERTRGRYSGAHPEAAVAKTRVTVLEGRLSDHLEIREWHMQTMREADPMREKLIGPRPHALTLYDFSVFAFMAAVGIGGNIVALSNLATYAADSGVIASLTDNFFRSLIVSAIPFSGSALFKALGALQGSDMAERAFYRRLARCAVAFVSAHIISLAIVFAPHKLDAAALAQALANGVAPTNPVVEALQYIASYLVLGTGLFAEMIIAPVVIAYASKLHRAGREITVTLSAEHVAHRAALVDSDRQIDEVVEQLGQARSELDRHTSALAEMTDATLQMHHETAADFKADERRFTHEFFVKRAKGGSR